MATNATQEVSRDLCKQVTAEIAEAARAILQKHGLEMAPTKSKFGAEYQLTLKASPLRLGKNGVNLASMDAQMWLLYSTSMYGISAQQAKDALGEVIYSNAKTGDCILIGFNDKKRKMPVMARSLRDGKEYFLPETSLAKFGIKPLRGVYA
jgi:hypothetical protein